MDTLKRNKKLLWVLVALVAVGLVFALVKRAKEDPADKVVVQPVAGETVVTGTFTCLPLKSGAEIAPEDCVMGLAADGPTDAYMNKMYALDSSQVTIVSHTIGAKDRVRVVGTVTVPNTSIDEGNAFKIDGIIKVRAMQHA